MLGKIVFSFLITFCFCRSEGAVFAAEKSSTPWTLYVYIPVQITPSAKPIQQCLSTPEFQTAHLAIRAPKIGYHVSLGEFSLSDKSQAEALGRKIHAMVTNHFSPFTAKVDKEHGGVTMFGNYVVMVLKTADRRNNQHQQLFVKIHDYIKKTALLSCAQAKENFPFVPHCSLSHYPLSSQEEFVKIKTNLLRQLASITTEDRLILDPDHLRFIVYHTKCKTYYY